MIRRLEVIQPPFHNPESSRGGMDSIQAARRVNLSYVLHERSDSEAVSNTLVRIEQFARNKAALVAHFNDFSRSELRDRTFVEPAMERQIRSGAIPQLIIAPRLGMFELLGRPELAKVWQAGKPDPYRILPFESCESSNQTVTATLFRGTASVRSPEISMADQAVIAASLVLRPDGESLMLTGRLLEPSTERAGNELRWSTELLEAIETLIRSFTDQWLAVTQLWQRPVEVSLPEFGLSRQQESG